MTLSESFQMVVKVLKYISYLLSLDVTQSAGAVEYIDCISAER